MDDAKLEELQQSMALVGLINPITVKPLADSTYEVVAGHRRLVCAQRLNWVDVPCRIIPADASAEAVKAHENAFREDLSPVEEAAWYAELYDQADHDVEKVAAMVRRPLSHVERRLVLLRADQTILDALSKGDITLGVAEELARLKRDEDRAFYLGFAVRGGCSIRQAREWRSQANARADISEAAAVAGQSPGPGDVSAQQPPPPTLSYVHSATPDELSGSTALRACCFCGDEHQEWQGYRKFVCRPCADQAFTPVALRGDPPRNPVDVSPRARAARESRELDRTTASGGERNEQQ